MRIAIVFDESDISFTIASRAVNKFLQNPKVRSVIVDNDSFIVKHTSGSAVYTVISEESIKDAMKRK